MHKQLLAMMEAAGIKVLGRSEVWPTHSKASDPDDPLRAAERTSLWRLGMRWIAGLVVGA